MSDLAGGKLVSALTEFQRRSIKPGGPTREHAIAAANKTLEQNHGKISQRIDAAFDAIAVLVGQANWQTSDVMLEKLAIHVATLRDYTPLVELSTVSTISAALCNILSLMKVNTISAKPETLQGFVDAISSARKLKADTEPTGDITQLVAGLKAIEATLLASEMRCIW